MTDHLSFLKSMTAYGQGTSLSSLGTFTVEIQSVNRKHLDFQLYSPRLFLKFESEIRQWIANRITRGMLNIWIHWIPSEHSQTSIIPNISYAKELKQAWEQLAQILNLEKKIPTEFLAQEKDLFISQQQKMDDQELLAVLKEAVEKALSQLLEMKESEGEKLAKDILERLKQLKVEFKMIEDFAPRMVEKFREKLKPRLKELFPETGESEERLLREAVIYADKVDITEELTRVNSHLEQFEKTLLQKQQTGEGKGKKLDFLIQELNRESNTMNSKASDLEIIKSVMRIKGELEKIREQVQNIE